MPRWFKLGFFILGGACAEMPSMPSHDVHGSAATCAPCHPLQFQEWQGSIMHYAAVSPVFNAFELTMRELSNGTIAADGAQPNFCSRCHTPIGEYQGELPFEQDGVARAPALAGLSNVAAEGITCDFCHTVTGPDLTGSLEGDGIANLALKFAPGATKRGPLDDPQVSTYHVAASTDYLRTSAFCGACHDVRLFHLDQRTEAPARLENLFTEWKSSRYAFNNNVLRRPIECQDCHMSRFPVGSPGDFPRATIAVGGAPDRPHALHAFTAVSVPLVDDPRFPRNDDPSLDDFGFPRGQAQRREQMLRAACTLSLSGTPTEVPADQGVLGIRLMVTNVGAGHRVPSGFSEERQVWIHLVVRDQAGLVYESGGLVDRPHPETGEVLADGRVDDEDLQDKLRDVDPATLTSVDQDGPDRSLRPTQELGLINFQNAFLARNAAGEWVEVINPLLAETIDDRRSLPPQVGVPLRYDVPLSRRLVGPVQVTATLRFRSFPPYLLRALARRHPELLSEQHVDRNLVVDMAEARATIVTR
ncbi:MAG: hypothetical protein IPG45_16920 [Deltaproteobacteria bacterium]|nr:hypothetical protein [Deltaproteobacteria bacterium]